MIDVKVSQRALREIYLRGFEIVVREARAVDGHVLLQQAERHLHVGEPGAARPACCADDWGFDGPGDDRLVRRQGRRRPDERRATTCSMPGTARQQKALLAALESGALKTDVLDRNVERILEIDPALAVVQEDRPLRQPDLTAHATVGPRRRRAGHGAAAERGRAAAPAGGEDARALRQHLLRDDHRGHRQRRRERGLHRLAGRGPEGRRHHGRRRRSPTAYAALHRRPEKKQPPRPGRSCRRRRCRR